MNERLREVTALVQELEPEVQAALVVTLAHHLPEGALKTKADSRQRFVVPDHIRCLSPMQLEYLDRVAEEKVRAARSPQSARTAERIRMLFQLLRWSGAKLGEVLALDDTKDVDFDRLSIHFPEGNGEGAHGREVLMPASFMRALRVFLDSPQICSLRGTVFHLDPGFVRKKLYELAESAGLQRDELNPTVLRNSRAVELLRAGTPLMLVQAQLGSSSLESASGYCSYPDEVARRILSSCIQKEFPMKTSARNTFSGLVTDVKTGGILSEVTIRTDLGMEVVSIITNESREALGIVPGRPLIAMVKAPWVLVSKDETEAELSARNRYAAKVTKIHGDDLTVEVIGELDDGTLMCALATGTSVDKLGLKLGDRVHFFFKAMNVILTGD